MSDSKSFVNDLRWALTTQSRIVAQVFFFVMKSARPRTQVLLSLGLNRKVPARLVSKDKVTVLLHWTNALEVASLLNFEQRGLITIERIISNEAIIRLSNGSVLTIPLSHQRTLPLIEEGKVEIISVHGSEVILKIPELGLQLSGPFRLLDEVLRYMTSGHYYNHIDVAGKVVVDIGGYLGETAICFASRGAKVVYMFEPSEEFFAFAERNTAPYKNIIALPFGLGSEDATAFLAGDGIGKAVNSEGSETAKVRDAKTVLKEIIRNEGEIGLMKVNCEGCEWELMKCLDKSILDHVSAIDLEIHGGDHRVPLAWLERQGFVREQGDPVGIAQIQKYFLQGQKQAISST